MREVFRTLIASPSGIIGVVILLAILLMAISAPLFFSQSPWEIVTVPFSAPGENGMLLGSDTLGRDIAAGIAHGARVSLLVGVTSTLAALLIGVTLGGVAGYAGGYTDKLIVRFTEIFQTIPSFILALLLVAILSPSIGTIILAIALVSWPPLARVTRVQVMSISTREFVLAARCQGQSTSSIFLRHVLPNAVSPIIVVGSVTVASAILIEAALSFMGLGDPNFMSWGYMIGSGRAVIRQAWWMSTFPGVATLLSVVAINMFCEALNDAINPRVARA